MGTLVRENRCFLSSKLADDLGAVLYASKHISGPSIRNDAPYQARGGHSKVLRDLEKEKYVRVPRNHKEIPELRDEQMRQAITVFPGEYWKLIFGSSRDEGH